MAADAAKNYQVTIRLEELIVNGTVVLLYWHTVFHCDAWHGPYSISYIDNQWIMNGGLHNAIRSVTNDAKNITVSISTESGLQSVYATVIHTDISNIK